MRHDSANFSKLASLIAIIVAIPLAFWVRQQGMGAFMLILVLLLCVPFLIGLLIRVPTAIFPALCFNLTFAGTTSYLAATEILGGGQKPFTIESLSNFDAVIGGFAFVTAFISFIPVAFARIAAAEAKRQGFEPILKNVDDSGRPTQE